MSNLLLMRWLFSGCMALGMASGFAQQPATSSSWAHSLNDAFTGVFEKASPSVVVIEVRHPLGSVLQGLPSGLNVILRQSPRLPQSGMEQGSGIILSPDGYILTNQHVVGGADDSNITVTLKDGRKFDAKLIGVDDELSDIAVLKINAEKLPVAELGDSDKVKVGQFAFAIGAPYGLPYTFTVGVISAKGRKDLGPDYAEYLQTDTAINPGNSGGPLCDIDGRVVGINTLISAGDRGLGFALPIKTAKKLADQLIADGHVARAWLGIGIIGAGVGEDDEGSPSDNSKPGVLVRSMEPGAPALSSDLRVGDIIMKVDGVAVMDCRDLKREILGKKIGQSVKLSIVRDDQPLEVSVPTGARPSPIVQAVNQQGVFPAPINQQIFGRNPPARSRDDGTHGLTLRDVEGEGTSGGAVIDTVAENSEADTSGLEAGDIITEAGGKPVRNAKDFQAILDQSDLGRGVMVMIDRHGQKTFAILKF